MIYEVSVKDPSKTPVEWWPKVPFLAAPGTVIKFEPGLNVLFGPNGSGKTTLLIALARLFHCEQGGVPTLTKSSICALKTRGQFREDSLGGLQGLAVKHDSIIVGYFDPSKRIGSIGGSFDDDFFDEGLRSVFVKGSSGQLHMDKLVRIFKQTPKPIDDKLGERVNSLWLGWRNQALVAAKTNAPGGQPTWLLDEPERSLDIPRRVNLWETIAEASVTRQIILASHDPISILMPSLNGANFIEMVPGYLDVCRTALRTIGATTEEPAVAVMGGK